MPSDPVAKRETPSRYFSSYSYDCRHYALGSLASQTPFLKEGLADPSETTPLADSTY